MSRPTLRERCRWLVAAVRGLPAWAKENRLRAGLAAAACVMALAVVVFGWVALASLREAHQHVTLEMVLEALDSGAYTEARELAQTLKERESRSVEVLAGTAFVLGAAAAYEADDTWSQEKTRYYLLASRRLEEARDRGFPPGREAEGLYLLGRSLYLSGQIPASRPVLRSALELHKDKKTEIHRLLAAAYLRDANPKLDKALAENTLYLADRKLSRTDRHHGLLQRAQILLRTGKISECVVSLEKIPSDAKNRAEAMILRGRLLMHEAQELKNRSAADAEGQLHARQKYQEAIQTLRRAQGRDTLATQATRKAMYLIGVCFLEREDYRAALAQFARARQLHAETPEGLAAGLQEAELSRQLGRDSDALQSYRRVLRAVNDPQNFSNPWITLDQLRSRMLTAYRHYLKTQNFAIGLQLTELFYPLFPRTRTLELKADGHRARGKALLAQAAHLPPERSDPIRHLARAQFRQAGQTYSRLARLQVATRKYSDRLWNSAIAYLHGQDYRNAVRVLKKYMKNESRRRYPQALVLLGEARLAQGQIDRALEAFQECIESYPRDAAAFRARVSASKAHLENGDPQKAEKPLRDNLSGEYLAPASKEWRDSLFALGELLHVEHRYQEAIGPLEEAVQRYPHGAQALHARHLIADSYHQRALAARETLKQQFAGSGRPARSKETNDLFNRALGVYETIEKILKQRRETAELAPLEMLMLRNCYFTIGNIRFDLGQYEAAVKAYSTAINRYPDRPEVLTAYVKIANAYRRMGRAAEARASLKRAKRVLQDMKPESKFNETTNHSRQEWSELLDSLAGL